MIYLQNFPSQIENYLNCTNSNHLILIFYDDGDSIWEPMFESTAKL